MDSALKAISSPTRRRILTLVWDRERSSGDIARRAGLSAPAASQHLKVLKKAGLVDVRVDGQHRLYRARPETLQGLRQALEAFWGDRLEVLKTAAEAMAPTSLERRRRR